jgi:hypothetical protein
MPHQGANVAGRCGDHRQTGGKRLENRDRLIVDHRCIQENIGVVVHARHVFRLDPADEAHIVEARGAHQEAEPWLFRTIPCDGERRLGYSRLQLRICLNDHVHAVVGLEVTRRQQVRSQWPPGPVGELRQVDHVWNYVSGVTVASKHLAQVFRRHHDVVRQS